MIALLNPFWGSGTFSFANVKILCHFDSVLSGAGGTDPYRFLNTANGGIPAIEADNGTPYATIDTTNPKFGAGALKYPSGNGWPIRSHSNLDINPGTGDFTEEWWQYLPTDVTTTRYLLDTRQTASTNGFIVSAFATGVIEFQFAGGLPSAGSGQIISASNALIVNTWQHVAVSKASNVTRMFVAGNQVGSDYADTNDYNQMTIHSLGAYYNSFQSATLCSFDEWRFTLGFGLYTANFTPPTAAFPDS